MKVWEILLASVGEWSMLVRFGPGLSTSAVTSLAGWVEPILQCDVWFEAHQISEACDVEQQAAQLS